MLSKTVRPAGFGLANLAAALFYTPAVTAAPCNDAKNPAVQIIQPATQVPQEYKQFSGSWGPDEWDQELCHRVVVSKVEPDGKVAFQYCHGSSTNPNYRAPEPACYANTGRIQQDSEGFYVLIADGWHGNLAYTMIGGKLHGQLGASLVVLPRER